jgi:hypothetical protein
MGTIVKTVKRWPAKRGNPQRSEIEKRVRKVIEDVREALRLGDPGAVDAVDQLDAGARSLRRERRALAEDGAAHREQDDNAEDDHHEDDPGA